MIREIHVQANVDLERPWATRVAWRSKHITTFHLNGHTLEDLNPAQTQTLELPSTA